MEGKIPVRITWMKNEKGKIESEVLIGLDDVFSEGISISKKIEKFKKRYLNLVKKAHVIIPQKKAVYRHKNSKKRSKTPAAKKQRWIDPETGAADYTEHGYRYEREEATEKHKDHMKPEAFSLFLFQNHPQNQDRTHSS